MTGECAKYKGSCIRLYSTESDLLIDTYGTMRGETIQICTFEQNLADFELRDVEGRVSDILYSANAQRVAPEIESDDKAMEQEMVRGDDLQIQWTTILRMIPTLRDCLSYLVC